MVAKRKPVQPRKTVLKKRSMIYLSVTPFLVGWQVKVQGSRVGRFATQKDAELCANFLGGLMSPASVKIHGRNGRIKREETFSRSADPPGTPG